MRALGVHWGTFQLTFEPIDDPPRALGRARAARHRADDRFVATEAGQGVQRSAGTMSFSAFGRIR